ncbi:hypothetical protein AX16_009272 [Volvariella volvacea WC 439]|nr:hypothetical protein AX16_009272 [Volvariella volvacea WC 439]
MLFSGQVKNGGTITRSEEDFHRANFFFCDGPSDPWLNPLLAKSLVVRHAAWISKCVHEQFFVPVGAYILDDAFEIERILPIEHETNPERSPAVKPSEPLNESDGRHECGKEPSIMMQIPNTSTPATPHARKRTGKLDILPPVGNNRCYRYLQDCNRPTKRMRIELDSSDAQLPSSPTLRVQEMKRIHGSSSALTRKSNMASRPSGQSEGRAQTVNGGRKLASAGKQNKTLNKKPTRTSNFVLLPPTRRLSSELLQVISVPSEEPKRVPHIKLSYSRPIQPIQNLSPYLLNRERISTESPFKYSVSEVLKAPGLEVGFFEPGKKFLGMKCKCVAIGKSVFDESSPL